MKKVLLGTAAVALGLAMSAPAQAADGVKLGVGGYFKGYMSWLDQDEVVNTDVRSFDTLRDTEVHFTGETTLDNGLTVGFHTELLDDHGDAFGVNESYAYFSGAWGRVNFGAEDGAAYLLQVAAPSADSNVDGLRQYVQPISFTSFTAAGTATDNTLDDLFTGALAVGDNVSFGADNANGGADDVVVGNFGASLTASSVFDYDHALSASDDKITYLTPVFSGFQFGASYTPELDATSNSLGGHTLDDNADDYGDVWEIAGRYEGQLGDVGVILGAGYAHASLETEEAAAADRIAFFRDVDNSNTFTAGDVVLSEQDDRTSWNAGLDLNWRAFGLGVVYLNDDNGVDGDDAESETWAVGLDYTTGPFKIAGSYLNNEQNFYTDSLETDRWTGGVVYTYGPGMTFRGSVSWLDFDEDVGTTNGSADATSLLLGTQINF